jgi:putative ABC transport system permease protein
MLSDLRYAVRLLLRSPGVTLFAFLALGIGIGANVIVFSVLNGVLLRGLPVPQPERLVRVYEEWEPLWPYSTASAPNYLDWKQRNNAFSDLAASRGEDLTLERDGGPERVKAAAVSPDYFHLLGVSPTIGRSFLSSEGELASSHVVILTEGICRELFGSIKDGVGRFVRLNAESYQVVGVMPDGFHFPDESIQLWVPLAFNESELAGRGNRWLSGLRSFVSFCCERRASSRLASLSVSSPLFVYAAYYKAFSTVLHRLILKPYSG